MTDKVENKVILGPFDLALEEPVYFKIELIPNQKIVKSIDMVNGFVHRGMESLVLQRNFLQNLILTEKVCGLCSNNHPFTYCLAVEEIAKIRVPLRAQYLRVVADEVKRIAGHLFNLGMLTHLIHETELMSLILDTREHYQDLKETIWGNRMDLNANTIGGVKYDLNSEKIALIYKIIDDTEDTIYSIINAFETDPSILNRLKGIGYLSMENALKFGVVGPVARASGVDNDVRKKSPYAAYNKLSFSVVLRKEGDVHARALVRLYEIIESIKIIECAIENLPIGNIILPEKPMIPAGEIVTRTEAPRGELLYYLKTDGNKIPLRMKWRVPTFMNWEALKVMIPDNKLEDVPVIFNSIDPCISCTER